MPKIPWRLAALVQTLADETLLAEALLFPGLAILHNDLEKLRKVLVERLKGQIKELPPADAYRHRLAKLPAIRELELEVPPLKADRHRQTPVRLRLHYVQWSQGSDAVMAYFPALQIEVLAADEDELAQQLLPQVRSALSRQKTPEHLRNLVLLEQRRGLTVRPLKLKVKLPTAKEAEQKQAESQAKESSVLKQIGFDLTKEDPRNSLLRTYEREDEVKRLAELLTSPQPRSVLLVGKSGAGKTAVVQELARRRSSLGLRETPLWSTSGSRIVAGMSGFGMWQERCHKLVQEAMKTKSIVHLDHLVELIEVGKGGGNPQGVASLLCPAIARGSLLAIAECTPQQVAVIEKEDPQLLEAFVQLEIAEASPEQTRSILQQVASSGRTKLESVIDAEALAVVDRLHRRYAAYSAAPGRPLRFLKNLLADRKQQHTITAPSVTAAFSHETGLPLFMLDDRVPLDVEATRRWFQSRVIGQPQPVDLIVDLIASVKAGLSRGGKPIASLLFIGPTGVGKTEMAKSLAEFLYQDPSRMIRFDMSEYAHPHAVERLIGGTLSTQGLLTQKVRDQPFMVVLLDEFEKAHPSFFDVLLQVLGEGRLTDGAGRVADFTSTVVIMTSNLGADSFRQANVGFGGEQAIAQHAERHFEQEVKAHLRPEMFNRLDRIVPFAPLDSQTIAKIAQRELERVIGRDGIRLRGVNLRIEEGVIEHLAKTGYDVRYGARPLKRAIERELVAPLAEQLTRYGSDVVLTSAVNVAGDRLVVATSARPAPGKGSLGGAAAGNTLTALNEVVDLRRKVQALQNCSAILQARNDIQRIRQAQKQERRRAKRLGRESKFIFTPADARALKQEQLLDRLDRLTGEITTLEEMSLLDLYSNRNISEEAVQSSCSSLRAELNNLLFDVYQQQPGRPKELTLVVTGEHIDHVCELGRIYERISLQFGGAVQRYWLKFYRAELDRESNLPLPRGVTEYPVLQLAGRHESNPEAKQKLLQAFEAPTSFAPVAPGSIGLALQITNARAIALLETEEGAHLFEHSANRKLYCHVEALSFPLAAFDPPANIGRQSAYSAQALRRHFVFESAHCLDPFVKQRYDLEKDQLGNVIQLAVEDYLANRIWALLEQWN